MTKTQSQTQTQSQPPSHTLYISNLNDQINQSTQIHNLYILFSTYGDIIRINYNNKKLRGQAFIVFDSIENASLAMRNLQGELFFGKILKIGYSNMENHLVIKELEKLN